MNAEFSRCCDFLARMIEKYGLLVLQEYYAELKIEIDEWKPWRRESTVSR